MKLTALLPRATLSRPSAPHAEDAESKGSLKESTLAQVRFTPLQPELEEGKGVGGRPESR